MYFLLGKNRNDCNEIKAGDVGALVKLKNAKVMNSIVALGSKMAIVPVELPTATSWQALKAVNQSDEDKIGTALQKVIGEDPTIRYELNLETHENVLSGMGEQQLQLVLKKLKKPL
jgi:elongation factor G